MAKTGTNHDKLEREYTIPLRREWRKVPRYKRTNKAVKAIKEFLARHMKIRDRDLKKIKISTSLNEILWTRGIKKPPAKTRVKAVKDGGNVMVNAVDVPEKIKFREARKEKTEKKAVELLESKKSLMQKAKEGMQAGAVPKALEERTEEKEEKKAQEKEKVSAVAESGEKMEKEAAKKMKHQAKGERSQRQVRKSLAK